ncbi:MAG: ribosome maturation factor RimP [Thiotrichales bacterium]|nr:ribosome maturation factor RimP [Pseudomonadota bacterium]MCI4410980.1 ribosome maturation factor RimP [Thiotrichales bacterium]
MTLLEKLEHMLRPVVTGLQYDLWGIEFARHAHSATLRIYIDKANGVTVDDCARVSRQVSAVMDVEDPIDVAYRLEISSPGLERTFFYYEQLAHYVGQEIRVRTHTQGKGKKRNFTGVLRGCENGQLSLQDEAGQLIDFLWSEVDKASLIVRFDD